MEPNSGQHSEQISKSLDDEFPTVFKRNFYENKTQSKQAIEKYTFMLEKAKEVQNYKAEALILLYLGAAC